MTDEAHRTQYDVLALNMRNALPNAAFLAFTGTPLMAGEETHAQVFGDYVSIYNFAQSVEDHATVPLYYENRIPELQLTNENLNADMDNCWMKPMLDERPGETAGARVFARIPPDHPQTTAWRRSPRISSLHFMGRGFQGKAMVVSIDKATAVQHVRQGAEASGMIARWLDPDSWRGRIGNLRRRLEAARRLAGKHPLYAPDRYGGGHLSGAKRNRRYGEKGLDILPHRKRMVEEDLDTKFKDPDDPFRIVFVCAMWMTGFDVPSCSTIYLDKPMRNHTLMQTIARANRVWGEKVNGLIVDYIGVFRDLQKALAIYGSASGGGVEPGELPVETKQALVEQLEAAIQRPGNF